MSGRYSSSSPVVNVNWLKIDPGLGVMVVSNWFTIANGIPGVGVIVGVSVTDGVSVMVGESVMVGVNVMVGVSVTVGVRVKVAVGGKKR